MTSTTTSTAPVAPVTIPELPADLAAGLRRLKLAAVRRIAPEVLITAKTQRWTPEEVLRTLIEAEITARDASNEANRLKAATFPVLKTIDAFDVTASSIPPATFAYLTSLEWLRNKANLALIGPPGTGKSHTLIALGHAAVIAGHRVKYCTAADLVETLYRGLADNSVGRDHRHPAPQRPTHPGRSRVRTTGRHRNPTPVPACRGRLRTPQPRDRLTLGLRGMGPLPARTHHRRQHPGPTPAPRHRRRHQRRVLPHARRPQPPGSRPRPTKPEISASGWGLTTGHQRGHQDGH